MSKTPLYKMLQDVPSSGGWTLATLLDGSVSGSQLLLQAGKPVWQAGRLTLCAEICPDCRAAPPRVYS